uniref:hypothetical protein n=1 Tax=Psammodictyon constrictum TaxID=515483 RepID=UPI001EF9F115|nr:hypothetical protein MKU01_pgp106 [Psammodictyon constrictum]YP_010283348.1 hypothetical protein MKU01_pgp026 [Psammodictyon constrictum]ULD16387.1 hypothetical protein [Psammodictyon constrictum]ULD16467.1 hypothetical protein [Psammodictyon constrictum]
MKETLQNLILDNDSNDGFTIRKQKFSNEISFKKRIFRGIIDRVNLSNCLFKTMHLLRTSFCDCVFENCEIIHSEAIKTDFEETIFKNCEFKQVDFGWSYFTNSQLLELRLDDINFEGTLMSD